MPKQLDPNLPHRRVYLDLPPDIHAAASDHVRKNGITLKHYLASLITADISAREAPETKKGKAK